MSLFFCFTFEFFLLTVMPSAFTFYVQRLTKPLSEPTGTVFFSGDSRKTESFNTTVQIYAISFLSRSLLLNSRIICSSTPVKRLKPVAFLRQSHYFSPQYLLFTSAPNETASSVSGVPHLIRRPAPKARGTMRFSSAAPFIFSSRSLGGVQLGDQYPNNITIWAWPMKGFKKVSPLYSCLTFGPHLFSFWAMPTNPMIKISLFASHLKNKIVERDTILVCLDLNVLTRFVKISGGFTRVFDLYVLPYIYFTKKKLLVDSPGPCSILFPCLLFFKGEDFSASLSSKCSSFYTVLLSCVAVCTGPEDTSETTSVYFVGENWVSMSLIIVTKFQLSDYIVKFLSTHSSFALNSLSSSFEDLSILASFVYVIYAYNQRGWIIPSSCNPNQ